MLSYPIVGAREGTLRAERDGLYWSILAQCSRDWPHPIRLLACSGPVQTVLGVPQPEDGQLCLRARLSDRRVHFTPEMRVMTDQPPQCLEPFDPSCPFSRIAEFCVLDFIVRDGRPYWVLPTEKTE